MRWFIAFAIVLCIIFSGTSLLAQNNNYFGFGGGMSLLLEPEGVKDIWDNGYFGGVDFGFGASFLSLQFILEYGVHPLNDAGFTEALEKAEGVSLSGLSIDGGDVKVLGGFAMLKLNFSPKPTGWNPYLSGGVGMVRVEISDADVSYQGQSETIEIDEGDEAFALSFGTGFDLKFSPKTALFAELRYVTAFFEDAEVEVNEPDLGGNFVYMPIKAGFRFYF